MKWVTVFQEILILVFLSTTLATQDTRTHIYGGKKAGNYEIIDGKDTMVNDGKYPYMVGVSQKDFFLCGGALIKLGLVVTAAHCFTGIAVSDVHIWAGSYKKLDKQSNTMQIQTASEVLLHNSFNPKSKDLQANDIALVFLKKEFKLTPFVKIIPMATRIERDKLTRKDVVIMGYGTREHNLISHDLLTAVVTMLNKDQCNAAVPISLYKREIICVQCQKEKCTVGGGDSGSPVVHIDEHGKHILLGIVSLGLNFKKSKVSSPYGPVLCSDVAEFKEWISQAKKSPSPKLNWFQKILKRN